MTSRARQAVAPVYLLLCLLLGGSAQGIWANMLLQIIGLALIAWSALAPLRAPLSRPARQLLWLAIAAVALVALQLIPLPLGLWAKLGGRAELAADYAVLGLRPALLPLSLTPYLSLATLFALIPPLAMLVTIIRLDAYRPSWLCAALIAGTAAGIVLGALQVGSGDPLSSNWYLFDQSSFGAATGFFANANHMATLLVITLPFLAALAAATRGTDKQLYSTLLLICAAATVVIIVGIALNGSLAGYAFVLPAIAGAGLVLLPPRSPLKPWAAGAAALLLLTALAMIGTGTLSRIAGSGGAATSVESRAEMLRVTGRAIGDFMPLGSGLGSFEQVYRLYENPAAVTSTYVIHAHNDYAELVLELGFGGIALIVAFLAWWAIAAWAAWRSLGSQPYARAASVATAIILAHSLVDFPLRTAAIAASFAMGLALLAERRRPPANPQDLRPSRHLVFR